MNDLIIGLQDFFIEWLFVDQIMRINRFCLPSDIDNLLTLLASVIQEDLVICGLFICDFA